MIFRIRDAQDSVAWSEFVEIYGPFIYRYGLNRGLLDADAADLSQSVLIEVARCIDRFDYDHKLGRFRNWLVVIARSKLSNLKKKDAKLDVSGGSQALRILSERPADSELADNWQQEYREHLFHWAAEHVRNEIEDATWKAFWLTAAENRSPADVSKELGLKVGTVYVAKSRVLVRIRAKLSEVDDTIGED